MLKWLTKPWCQKLSKFSRDRPTDRRTDRPTDRPTDKTTHRSSDPELKKSHIICFLGRKSMYIVIIVNEQFWCKLTTKQLLHLGKTVTGQGIRWDPMVDYVYKIKGFSKQYFEWIHTVIMHKICFTDSQIHW